MMKTIFIRALDAKDKTRRLEDAACSIRDGRDARATYVRDAERLLDIPGFPIAYWASDSFLDVFGRHLSFGSEGRSASVGLQTSDDFRFARLFWEPRVLPEEDRWHFFAKGGEYRPFFSDVHLMVNWNHDGREIKNFLDPSSGKLKSRPQNTSFYFKEGITWPERTTSGFSPQALPKKCIISQVGLGMYLDKRHRAPWLAIANTRVYQYFAELLIGLGEETVSGSAGRHYTSGIVSKLPFPTELMEAARAELEEGALLQFEAARYLSTFNECSTEFCPAGVGQHDRIKDLALHTRQTQLRQYHRALLESAKVEKVVRDFLRLSHDDLEDVISIVGLHPVLDIPEVDDAIAAERISEFSEDRLQEIIDQAVADGMAGRSITKKSFFVSRYHEVVAQVASVPATQIIGIELRRTGVSDSKLKEVASQVFSLLFGACYGRWDLGMLRGAQSIGLRDPFESIPLVSNAINRFFDTQSSSVLLACDSRMSRPLDESLRHAIDEIWHDKSGAIEEEMCSLLGVDSLSEYVWSGRFFDEHLTRYTRSRRKAPIYWPLSTTSGSYTLWVYYPNLTSQTLYTAINDFIEPKLKLAGADVTALRSKGSSRTRDDEKNFEALQAFELELIELRDTLLKLALSYKPNHDDGVQITAAPLWPLFRHKTWQKVLKATWGKLEKGDYDWSHLAMNYWPDRVREKCKTDKSFAIAHGLEDLYMEPEAKPKKARRKRKAGSDE